MSSKPESGCSGPPRQRNGQRVGKRSEHERRQPETLAPETGNGLLPTDPAPSPTHGQTPFFACLRPSEPREGKRASMSKTNRTILARGMILAISVAVLLTGQLS